MTDAMGSGPNSDQLPVGIVTCDATGRMTYLNKRMLDWLGAESAAPFLDRPFYTVLSPAGKIYFETHLRPMLVIEGHCSEISLELRNQANVGHRIYLSGSVERDATGDIKAIHLICFEGTDRHSYEQELLLRRRKAESYGAIVAASPDAIVNVDAHNTVLSWNAAAERLFGYQEDEALDRTLAALIELDDQTDDTHNIAYASDADQIATAEINRRTKTGDIVPIEASIAKITDERGNFAGSVQILRDITERKRTEKTIQTLNLEVLHRSKNLLAVVKSLATMTVRHTDPADFLDVFQQRLSSVANNLELLVQRNWTTVDLGALITQQLAHLGPETQDRITINGPVEQLSPNHAEALGMAFFELSTNALKYGALATPDGTVDVTWDKTDEDVLTLRWTETGAENVSAPTRSGFGSMLTGTLLRAAVSGSVDAQFQSDGLIWTCVFTP